jgi:lipoate-protein ligase A
LNLLFFKAFDFDKMSLFNRYPKNKLIEKTVPSPVSPPPPTSKSNIPPHVQKAINTIVHYISNVSNSKLDTIQSPFLAVQKQASSMARK